MYSPAIILPFFLLFFTYTAIAQIPKTQTAYEVLQEYDFPVGVLPASVTSYTLNKETGEFMVNLGTKCSYKADGYHVMFKPTISGVISKDKVTKLKGVGVKIMFAWVEIKEAIRHGNEVDFSIGMFSAGFDVDDLEESPQCGCGFDCNDLEMKGEKKMEKLSKLLDWSI